MAHYGLDTPGVVSKGKALDIATDLIFRCPAEVVARTRSTKGQPVWVYRFEHVGTDGKPIVHGSEIKAVLDRGTGGAAPMQDYWLAFARDGDPNAPGLPAWPRFGGARRMVMHFGQDKAIARSDADDPVCPMTTLP